MVFWFGSVETGSLYASQAGLKLKIHLPQLPQCWHDRYAPPHLALKFFLSHPVYLFFCVLFMLSLL
jgi:hypothetical protein